MKEMLNKVNGVLEYLIFIAFFVIVMLIPLMLYGAIVTPIRHYKYVVNKVNNKECKKYWY